MQTEFSFDHAWNVAMAGLHPSICPYDSSRGNEWKTCESLNAFINELMAFISSLLLLHFPPFCPSLVSSASSSCIRPQRFHTLFISGAALSPNALPLHASVRCTALLPYEPSPLKMLSHFTLLTLALSWFRLFASHLSLSLVYTWR